MTKKKLERFLDVRERILDIRKGALAAAEVEVDRAAQAADAARRAEDDAVASLGRPALSSADDLVLRARLVLAALQGVQQAHTTLAEMKEQRLACAEVATAATRDVRALECLRERVTLRDRVAERQVEQARSDEAAAQTLARAAGARR